MFLRGCEKFLTCPAWLLLSKTYKPEIADGPVRTGPAVPKSGPVPRLGPVCRTGLISADFSFLLCQQMPPNH